MRQPKLVDLREEINKLHTVAVADSEDIDIQFKGQEIEHDRLAVVDIADMKELGVHKKGYALTRHEDVLGAIRRVTGDLIQGSVGTWNEGRNLYAYIYPSEWRGSVDDSDIIQFGLKVRNSYDGTSALRLSVIGMRVVCENGLYAPISEQKRSYHKHTTPVVEDGEPKLEEFKAELDMMLGMDVDEILETYREAKNLEVDVEDTIEALRLPKSLQTEVVDEIETERETAWDVYNTVTRKISHGYGDSGGAEDMSESYLERLHKQANRVLRPDIVNDIEEVAEA